MRNRKLNYEAYQAFGAIPVSCEGGLDFLTSKVRVNPGSLQDCMNYEVGRESGYRIMNGLLRYNGRSEYVLNRSIQAHFTESTAVMEDFFLGGVYSVSSTTSNEFIAKIKIFYLHEPGGGHGDGHSHTIRFQIIEGDEADLSGENGNANFRVYPNSNNISNYITLHHPEATTYNGISDYISETISLNQNIAGGSATLPGTGPVNIMFELDDRIYAGRDIDPQPESYIYLAGHGTNIIYAFSATENSIDVIDTVSDSNDSTFLTVDPDFEYLWCQDASDELAFYQLDSDGTFEGTSGSATNRPDDTTYDVAFTSDGAYMFVAHDTKAPGGSSFANKNISAFTRTGTTLTLVEAFAVDGGTQPVTWIAVSPTDDRLVVACDGKLFLLSFDGSNFTQEDSVIPNYTTRMQPVYVGNTRIVTQESTNELAIYDTTGDSFSSVVDTSAQYTGFLSDYSANGFIFGVNNEGSVTNSNLTALKIDTLGEFEVIDQLEDIDFADDSDLLRCHPNGESIFSVGDAATGGVDNTLYLTRFNGTSLQIVDSSPIPGGPTLSQGAMGTYFVTSSSTTGTRLYTPTDTENLAKNVEWETVDMGYEVGFDAGLQTSVTTYDLEFLGLDFETPENPTEVLGRFAESRDNADASVPAVPYADWRDLINALDDESNNTTVATRSNNNTSNWSVNTWYTTKTLRIQNFPFEEETNRFIGVAGVEVDVRWKFDNSPAVSGNFASPQAQLTSATLVNVGGTSTKSDASTYTTPNTFVTSTLGGSTDTWSAANPDINNFASDNFGVDLAFRTRFTSAGTLDAGAQSVSVDWVKITLYLENATEKVYFWNGSSDVANAKIIDYHIEDGTFEKADAEGFLQLYNVVNPASIVEDLEIRTKSSGGGLLIAETTTKAEVPLLPSSNDMAVEKSLAETIKANFYIDDEKEAIYGVTGAGPAFVYDGQYYRKIRSPVPLEKDKPRHIAEHQGHLVLAFPSGSIIVSVVGEPTNFSGIEGASEFGFGDRITGLIGLTGTALGVLCEQSTHTLVGNTIDNFTTQTISKSTGAIEYTLANMGQPLYCDFRGVANIAATDQYGDFSWGRLSQLISDWLQERLQDSNNSVEGLTSPVLAMPIRNKNQYRLFFNDGIVLTMTLQGSQPNNPQFTVQNFAFDADNPDVVDRTYVPTACLSTVMRSGREINAIGTNDGQIYIMDQGTGIYTSSGLTGYDAFITFNPFNGGMTHGNLRYKEVIIHGLTSGYQELSTSAGVNYFDPNSTDFVESLTIGDSANDLKISCGILKRVPGRVSTHIPEITDGYSLKISSTANGNLPHTIQALTFRAKPLSDKNAAPERY